MAARRILGRTLTRRIALGASIAALLAAFAASAAATTVTLRDRPEVAGAQVRLGEIAAIGDADAETAARLEAVVVGSAPLAGTSRRLSLESLRVQLRRAGLDPDAMRLQGPETVTVTRACTVVAGSEIEQAAREAVLDRLLEGGEIVVTCPRPPKDLVVPRGAVDLHAQIAGSARGPSRIVRVQVRVDGETAGRSTVYLRVEQYDDVLVAARDVPHGEPLAPEAVTLERRDLMQIAGTPLRDPAAVAGCRARLRLSAGAVVTQQAIERIPVIKRGDPVIVTLRVGAIRITLGGVARNDAAAGEAVRVQNPVSRHEFTARAVAKGAAEMTL